MTGYLPLGFEFAAEITFPTAEGTTSGMILLHSIYHLQCCRPTQCVSPTIWCCNDDRNGESNLLAVYSMVQHIHVIFSISR